MQVSVRLTVHPSIGLFVYVFVCKVVGLFICQSNGLLVYPYVGWLVRWLVGLFFLSVYPSILLPVCLSVSDSPIDLDSLQDDLIKLQKL